MHQLPIADRLPSRLHLKHKAPPKAARAGGNACRLYRLLMPMNGRQSGTKNAGASCTIWIPMIGRGDGWDPERGACSGRAILCRIAGPEIRRWTNDIEQSLANPLHTIWMCLLPPEMQQCRECTEALAKSSTSGEHEEWTTTPGAAASAYMSPFMQYPGETRPQAHAADTATAGSLSAIILKCRFKKGGTGTKVTGYYSTLSLKFSLFAGALT